MARDTNATDDAQIEITTDSGTDVTVTADAGRLFVTAEKGPISLDRKSARLDTEQGHDVLNCGKQRTPDGEKVRVHIPVDDHLNEITQLREDSKSDVPLQYEVVEQTKRARTDGWGSGEVTVLKLSANKSITEMDERETDLNSKIDKEYDVPEDAEVGDEFRPGDLLGDARTEDEKEQDALDEAAETGEDVVISKTTTECNDDAKECNLDHVSRVATPDGDIETHRTHTH